MQNLNYLPAGKPLASSAALLVLIAILAFIALAYGVKSGASAAFDQHVIMAFRTTANPLTPVGPPWFQEFGRDVTAMGSFACLGFIFLATIGFLALARKWYLAAYMGAAVLGGLAISTALKLAFDRPRPDIPHTARVFTSSFPSGHSALSAVTFFTIAVLLTRSTEDVRTNAYFISLATFLIFAIGLSRLYLGLHYPTDVLSGWCFGTAWALVCWMTLERFHPALAPQGGSTQ